jgi:hypothetical protein
MLDVISYRHFLRLGSNKGSTAALLLVDVESAFEVRPLAIAKSRLIDSSI